MKEVTLTIIEADGGSVFYRDVSLGGAKEAEDVQALIDEADALGQEYDERIEVEGFFVTLWEDGKPLEA